MLVDFVLPDKKKIGLSLVVSSIWWLTSLKSFGDPLQVIQSELSQQAVFAGVGIFFYGDTICEVYRIP